VKKVDQIQTTTTTAGDTTDNDDVGDGKGVHGWSSLRDKVDEVDLHVLT